jgi:hypothetical protein
VIEPNRFPDSVFDRIGGFLPEEQRTVFFRYVAHLRTLNPKDELLVLAEGMALFTCIARQVPESIGAEREKLLTELVRLGAKHESATTNATADMRTLLTAHQKLLEQNIASWQNKEQQAAQSLDRIAKRFEEAANQCSARLQVACGEFQTATKEHHAAATKAQNWVARVSLETKAWPYVACAACGALLALLIAHFLAIGVPPP